MNNPADHPSVKAAFETQPVVLSLDTLRSTRPLPITATTSRKFLQILASIATIGLVEPLVVSRVFGEDVSYRVLDGRLRLEALRRLGVHEAVCLISTDDEPYTYNRHISRLTPAQDARMISKAIEHGVSRERIAAVLGIDTDTVRKHASLLEGVSPEAASLLADKSCPRTTFAVLKLMKPQRQLEAVELMCGQANFSSAFAKAILTATPDNQLQPDSTKRRKSNDEIGTQLARLERELATLQANANTTEEQYGIDQLHLTVSIAYIASLMSNQAIATWLATEYPEFATQFREMAKEADTASATRRPPRLPFQRGRNVHRPSAGAAKNSVA